MQNRIKVEVKGHAYTATLGNSFCHGFVGDKGYLYITDIEVDEKQQGRGIGKKLVNSIIKKSGVNPKHVKAVKIIPKAIPFWKALEISEGKKEFDSNRSLVNERETYIHDYLNSQR